MHARVAVAHAQAHMIAFSHRHTRAQACAITRARALWVVQGLAVLAMVFCTLLQYSFRCARPDCCAQQCSFGYHWAAA